MAFAILGRIGGMRPAAFHACNIIGHATVTGGLYFLCRRWVFVGADGFAASVTAGLLFAVHPIHCEAVAPAVGLAELLSAALFLCAVHAGLRANEEEPAGHRVITGAWLIASLVLAACSMLCKEQGLMAVAVVVTCDLLGGAPSSSCTSTKRRGIATRVAARAASLALLVAWRVSLNGGSSPFFDQYSNPLTASTPWKTFALTVAYTGATHVRLLLWPSPLSADWRLGANLVRTSWTERENWLSIGVAVGLLALVAASCRHQRRWKGARSKEEPAGGDWAHQALFGLVLLLVPFVPASNILVRVGFLVAERVMYTPSMGYCILLALGIVRTAGLVGRFATRVFGRRVTAATITVVLGALVVIPMCLAARRRNLDWQTRFGLDLATIRVFPDNAIALGALAQQSADRGDLERAERFGRAATRAVPAYHKGHYDLGKVLLRRGRYEEAEAAFRAGLKAVPPGTAFPPLHVGLGELYGVTHRLPEARAHMEEAVRLGESRPSHLLNLAMVCSALGEHRRAVGILEPLLATHSEPEVVRLHLAAARAKLS